MTDPETPGETVRPPYPWRWRRWLVLPLVALAGMLIAQAVHTYSRTALDLKQVLADLDASDPRWRLQEVEADRADVPDSANGARVVHAAARFLPDAWSHHSLDQTILGRPAEVRLSAEEYAELCETLGPPMDRALEAAATLPDRPRGRHQIEYQRVIISTLLPDQGRVHDVGKLLRLAAIRRAQEGSPAEALRWCLGALNAARSIGDEPVAVSQQIRVLNVIQACRALERVLAQGEAGEAELKRVQEALEEEDRHDGLLLTTRGERGSMYLMFDVVESGEIPASALLSAPATWRERYLGPFARGAVTSERALFLHLMTRRLEEVRRPMHEHPALERAFATDATRLSLKAPVTHALILAYTTAGPKFRRKHASVRAMAALLACERYRLAAGSWPERLGQVTPEFLPAVPPDPEDGWPLRFARLPDGARAWSVGEAGEVGFRLWDANRRGQPPRPKKADKLE
jgi:hypothetical protein